MWSSGDVALVVLIAVFAVVYSVFIAQMATVITGVQGLNYILFIGHAIWASVAFLLFEGRRWRFCLTATIISILTLPTYLMGAPFDLVPRVPAILNAFFADIIMNSFYVSFTKREKILIWSILSALTFSIGDILFRTLILPIVYPPEYVSPLLAVFFALSPIVVIEAIAGGIMGYRIYQRIKNITQTN